ncbi:unnamed protein product [Pleuronectes platessa]|uniref:Uncharacterized protein n=1 Tax=Pleuronectes platessa TaxID=8262 RepID=A0A9N7UT20_PLEPL|nr:unnamed protein product [Pleuronectes platessa]
MAEASTERGSRNAVTHGGDSGRGIDITQSKSCTGSERNERELTVMVEMEGEATMMELMKCVRELCGGLLAFRHIGGKTYEMTMSHPKGKERLMDGRKWKNRLNNKGLLSTRVPQYPVSLPSRAT